ncbi:3-hydroxyisobutyryl-CoA hydrolase [Nesterenkonia sp. HG001]|uniref:3-hydroxyisobutyryl-CoA hydrolase n=1 Tax=Nesterenkonia sp. HG001 TaxID=2983207 RepID=UPI002AC44A94|nr:3-hydroxyisobutyryl-CoA hydrolase [Nesterenkonia sp. HG001]MDZ5077625.1 3-hydroxyisobutyryl-CoA hydrolase [Nesterenkonia sp. HG001]
MGRETFTGDVAFEVRGHLGIITLNRPKAMNALTQLMCESVHIQLEEWASDDDVAQVLVRGAGERGLCAGGDVIGVYRDMVEHQERDGGPLLPDGTPAYRAHFATEDFWAVEYRMNLLIAQYPKPYIALMDGLVLGGGIGISAHGSHRIVTERTRAGMPETTIGFCPDVGGSYLLGHAPRKVGLHAGMLGAHLDAADAIHAGLADTRIDSASIDRLIAELTSESADEVLPQFAVDPGDSSLGAAEWINHVYSGNDVDIILARLDGVAGEVPEAAEAAAELRARSPLSVRVAHRAITTAAELSLRGALIQEYTVGMHMLRSHDFREGIRAQLVDKDRSPSWNPARLADVDDDLLDHFFTPVPHKILELPHD